MTKLQDMEMLQFDELMGKLNPQVEINNAEITTIINKEDCNKINKCGENTRGVWLNVLWFILWLVILTIIVYSIIYWAKPKWAMNNSRDQINYGMTFLWSFLIALFIIIIIYLIMWAINMV
jgi:uncharacterized membrane protein YidH (DUF202 family)